MKRIFQKIIQSSAILLIGGALTIASIAFIRINSQNVHAAPIEPPEGYPKFITSSKIVSPTLASPNGESLHYRIEIRNTGAYRADETLLTDVLPENTSYNSDAESSSGPAPNVSGGVLTWQGDVGFDSTVVISFSVDVQPDFEGTIQNTAVISHPMITEPVTVSAETVVTDQPLLSISKSAEPSTPGPGTPLTFTLTVENHGQPATGLNLNVTDRIPTSTTLFVVGADGSPRNNRQAVLWQRTVDLGTGASTVFTYSVNINDVPSGTVITNDEYQVSSTGLGTAVGEPYTTTVIDPILSVYKQIWPDPPGSNREATYTLTVLNKGSMATDLLITDEVPEQVTYLNGGSYEDGVVSWTLDRLGTRETAQFTYTVFIDDIAGVEVPNIDYGACSSEGVCAPGHPLTSVVQGPTFEVSAFLDPIAKKPGGGTGPVTPTLVVRNLGPGNALDATALLTFTRISVSANDLYADPPVGTPPPFPEGPVCGSKCDSYRWMGDLIAGDVVTFTTHEGQSTIGGEEGTHYTATIIISDTLLNGSTQPVTGTAIGTITHLANLIPTKSAPVVIGRGQLMTYTFTIWNSALSTDVPPQPWLTDTVPLSVSVVSVSDGGAVLSLGDSEVVSWTLPAMSPGDVFKRSYVVRVNDDLISGTQIVNDDYRVFWYELEDRVVLSNTGTAVTTTVRDTGLIDSFKQVTPGYALPGVGTVLTYYLHVVNSSPFPLQDVSLVDWLPWEHSTYQRDVVASSGSVSDDIVSILWDGDIAALDSEVLTFTVIVDPFFEGVLTNTAIIDHADLLEPVTVTAVAYITDQPVLRITKSASPDPVQVGSELKYTIRVSNLAQQATDLELYDVIPEGTEYAPASATAGGQLRSDRLVWDFPVLEPGEQRSFSFWTQVGNVRQIINSDYGVSSSEGASAQGLPVVTLTYGRSWIYMPYISR